MTARTPGTTQTVAFTCCSLSTREESEHLLQLTLYT